MLIFRQAKLSDLEALRAMEQGVIAAERPFNQAIRPEGAYYYDLPELIASPDSYLMVAEDDGVAVASGYVQIRPSRQAFVHDRHGYLGFMFVAESHRGQGLNKAILDRLMDWAQARGVSDFYLTVYPGNDSAIKAYEKAGFDVSLLEMKASASSRR